LFAVFIAEHIACYKFTAQNKSLLAAKRPEQRHKEAKYHIFDIVGPQKKGNAAYETTKQMGKNTGWSVCAVLISHTRAISAHSYSFGFSNIVANPKEPEIQ